MTLIKRQALFLAHFLLCKPRVDKERREIRLTVRFPIPSVTHTQDSPEYEKKNERERMVLCSKSTRGDFSLHICLTSFLIFFFQFSSSGAKMREA